jgi:hypothetical protein
VKVDISTFRIDFIAVRTTRLNRIISVSNFLGRTRGGVHMSRREEVENLGFISREVP